VNQEQQLLFNEIVFPADPGPNFWLIFCGGLAMLLIIFIAGRILYSSKKRNIRSSVRYFWLLGRRKFNLISKRELTDEIYHLLLAHFETPLLPQGNNLPASLRNHDEEWTTFKNRLNAARFSGITGDHEELNSLLKLCRKWIKQCN